MDFSLTTIPGEDDWLGLGEKGSLETGDNDLLESASLWKIDEASTSSLADVNEAVNVLIISRAFD